MPLPELTTKAVTTPLTHEEIQHACEHLLDEANSIESRADFLEALHRRGETPDEVADFVKVLLERAVKLPFDGQGAIDVCGTGGDKAGFFNISTAVMFVAAGAGARVIKHGNRGITSKSGGADVLEALGVRIDRSPDMIKMALHAAGCCFLFAPACHPAFKAVVPVRKLLAERGRASIFNILGPLLNPARPEFQLAGVFDPKLPATYAGVFKNLHRTRAWAVHGTGPDSLRVDEVSPFGKTRVHAFEHGSLREFEINPADFDLGPIAPSDLLGGDASANASILLSILDGSHRGAPRSAVLLNAAAALTVAGLAKNPIECWELAARSIDEGRALASLESLRKTTTT